MIDGLRQYFQTQRSANTGRNFSHDGARMHDSNRFAILAKDGPGGQSGNRDRNEAASPQRAITSGGSSSRYETRIQRRYSDSRCGASRPEVSLTQATARGGVSIFSANDQGPPVYTITPEEAVEVLCEAPQKTKVQAFNKMFDADEQQRIVRGRCTNDSFEFLHKKYSTCCPNAPALEMLQGRVRQAEANSRQNYEHCQQLERTLRAADTRHNQQIEDSAAEITRLQAKVQELEMIHLRSVNEVGAGLEPVTDQAFKEAFGDYHAVLFKWCRNNFGKKRKRREMHLVPDDIRAILRTRCEEGYLQELSLARVAEMLLWEGIETQLFCPVFPVQMFLSSEKNAFDLGTVIPKLEREDIETHHAKLDFWRSYSSCLFVQSPGYEAAFQHTSLEAVSSIMRDLLQLIDLDEGDAQPDSAALLDLMQQILRTAVQMKCQRGLFDIEGIPIGTKYHSKTMDDVNVEEYSSEERKKLVVKAVLSDGIIKRPWRDAGETIGRACKARVMVGLPNESAAK